MSMPTYDRKVLTEVLIYHQRTDISGCHCGWAELGASHAEHVADVYERMFANESHATKSEGATSA